MRNEAPEWFRDVYGKHGKAYAEFISDKPLLKWVTKKLMDIIVERKELKSQSIHPGKQLYFNMDIENCVDVPTKI